MSKTVLTEVNGFTPCIDVLTQQYGPMVSIVFGRVWRYCQGDQGVCTASIEHIARELRVSSRTVLRHVKLLAREGYLEDLDGPGVANRPHRYADTGKISLLMSMGVGMTNSQPGMTKSQSDYDNLSDLGMTKSQEKIQVKKDSKIQVKKDSNQLNIRSNNPDPETDAAIKAIEEVAVKYPPHAKPNSRRGTIKAAQDGYAQDFALKEEIEKSFGINVHWDTKYARDFLVWLKERPPEQTVTAFSKWWYHEDWRGKTGQAPRLEDIFSLWPQAFKTAQRDPRNVPAFDY